jgi:deoxyribodipyrimidine photo-lyase
MPQEQSPSIVWFRQDLRLADNPALAAAARRGAAIVALYVLDDPTPGDWAIGGAARWWLHHSLKSLRASLRLLGVPLVLRRGSGHQTIPLIAAEIGAGAVYWNRCYEPSAVARDTAIKSALTEAGIRAESFGVTLIAEPWTVKTQSGAPFRVFTPFWRALQNDLRLPRPEKTPDIRQTAPDIASDDLDDWKLLPTRPNWAAGFSDDWQPGEAGAQQRLDRFIEDALRRYPDGRNLPGIDGVSRLSPHLHWGEISIRQLWHAIGLHAGAGADAYLRELGWRDFAHHLLWHFPELPEKPFTERFAGFPWRDDAKGLKAWQRGQTGYPFVDAGMRQLWATGWMHNRVRMVTASFLVKHLLIPWRAGEDWFWDCLLDADLAANAMNWQWVAGSGADAAPYFRIFNPVLQGEKFDADGDYVRRWVPEIAALPDEWLHKPWMAPADILAKAGIILGTTYPKPIVDHAAARARALAALGTIKSS